MHIYEDPATGRRYTVGPDGTTRWLTPDEERQYVRTRDADPFPGGPAEAEPGSGPGSGVGSGAEPGSGPGTGANDGPGHARVPATGRGRPRWALPLAAGAAGLVLGGAIGSAGGDDPGAIRPLAGPVTVTRATTVPAAAPATVTATETVTATAKKAKTSKRAAAQPTTKQTTAAPKTDPRFSTCGAANAAGYGPYTRGVDPEYAWYLDRDGDGLVCET